MPRSLPSCQHLDIRRFDGVRTCLSCGVAIFETQASDSKIKPDPSQATSAIWSYDYRKLNFELGQEIRLVVVQPGEIRESIRCEIIHVNLEDDPEYAAVSYTWADEDGDDAKSRRIYCLNGTSIPVTVNCEAALRRLRVPGLKRRLWIDAICINQNNIFERNHQVGLMDRIYSKASKVCICIHDPRSNHQLAMSWLKGTTDPPDEDEMLLASVKALLSLRWFSRVWVIQEVALSNAAFLFVNETSVFLSSEVLQRLRLYCRSRGLQIPGPLKWSWELEEKHDLITCLDTTRGCSSSDPRDRIYAILSLVEPIFRKLIPIDYSKDLDWIITTVFVAAVSHYQNLDILSQVASASIVSEPFSWVPDLTSPAVSREPIEQLTEDLIINSRSPSILPVSSTLPVPWVRRITIEIAEERFKEIYSEIVEQVSTGTVQILQPEILTRSLIPRLRVRAHLLTAIPASKSRISSIKCLEFCEKVSSDVSVLQYYSWILNFFRNTPPENADLSEEWTDTRHCPLEALLHENEPIIWDEDQIFDYRAVAFEQLDELRPDPRILSMCKVTRFNLHDLASFLRDGIRWGEGRHLFEGNYSVGFTNGSYREGDQVFAIDGAKAPFILRSMGENQYKIVSDCYLWAALQLDYWNPGTLKGLWGVGNDNQPRKEQTGMIELL